MSSCLNRRQGRQDRQVQFKEKDIVSIFGSPQQKKKTPKKIKPKRTYPNTLHQSHNSANQKEEKKKKRESERARERARKKERKKGRKETDRTTTRTYYIRSPLLRLLVPHQKREDFNSSSSSSSSSSSPSASSYSYYHFTHSLTHSLTHYLSLTSLPILSTYYYCTGTRIISARITRTDLDNTSIGMI
ncbi:hypothetical protein EYC80_009615 [Monilinia laxa]|uniref:Uncharacterized protein n=1 Tax=Monilinia laxa TaxID=61186 RepID=A0A5N6JYF4_MONLA|nr:hypothetical protein EYC80_009615 [Monilinia laxa]